MRFIPNRIGCLWLASIIPLVCAGETMAVQYARPDGTITAGAWSVSGAPSHHEAIDESSPNGDTDYIQASANTTAEVSLTGVTDPGVDTGHVIRFNSLVQRTGSTVEVQLYQGAVPIASTGPRIHASSNIYETFAYTLSAGEAGTITDYSDLRLRIISSIDRRSVRVTWAELEVSDGGPGSPPTVANPSIAAVEDTTATLGGEVTDIGSTDVTERGIYWSTTSGFTPPGEGAKVSSTGTWTVPFTFTENVTGLPETVVIYFRAFATNSGGDAFSTEAEFRTEPTTQASNIQFSAVASTSMTISWTAGSGDGALVVMKEGSAVTQSPIDGTVHGFNTTFGTPGVDLGGGEYVVYRGASTSVDVTNLVAETTYFVKIFEYAGIGTGASGINYQQDSPPEASQTTSPTGPAVPTVTNTSIAAIEDTTATLGGEVTDIGGSNVSERGVYWSTTSGFTPPGEGTKVWSTGDWATPFVFTENVISLTQGVMIYFRAFATNSQGDSYSAEDSFQTEPTVQPSDILFSSITSNSMTVSWSAGSGDGVLVLAKQGPTFTQAPADWTEHNFNSSFGDPTTELGGAQEYVVYRGVANSVNITNLQAETTYYFKLFEYSGSGTDPNIGINYQQDGAPEASQITDIASGTPSHNAQHGIECNQCHALHGGLMPRGLDQYNTCTACHNASYMGAENTEMYEVALHVVDGGVTTIDCGSCHDVHLYDFNTDNTSHGGIVAENIARVRWDTTKYVDGALEPAIFQQRPEHFAFGETAFPGGPWNGICQSCHQNTKYHTSDGWDDDDGVEADNDHEIGGNCAVCHGHGDGFEATGCTGCHGLTADNSDGAPTRRAILGEFDLGSHHVGGGGAVKDSDCKVCHYEAVDSNSHQDNVVDLRDPDTGNPIAAFTKLTRDRTSDSLESWVTNVQNDFCLKCHDIGGATATYNSEEPGTSALRPFSSTSRDVPAVYGRFDPANSFHHAVRAAGGNPYCIPSGSNGNNVTLVSPWNQDGTHDQITCFDCHGDVVTDPDGTPNLVSAHGGDNQRMLRTSIDLDTMEATVNYANLPSGMGLTVETFCSICHKASVYVTTSDPEGVGSIFEHHGASQNQHQAAGGNELGCMGCHGGIVDFGALGVSNGEARGNIHGNSFTWPTGSFSEGGATEYFLLGGWLSGWEMSTPTPTTGYCRGGDCAHRNSSQDYTR
jgi:hypothetical protein